MDIDKVDWQDALLDLSLLRHVPLHVKGGGGFYALVDDVQEIPLGDGPEFVVEDRRDLEGVDLQFESAHHGHSPIKPFSVLVHRAPFNDQSIHVCRLDCD